MMPHRCKRSRIGCCTAARDGWKRSAAASRRRQCDNGRMSEIGADLRMRGAISIDASGRIVAPGFIDGHTPDDRSVLSSLAMMPGVCQGLTKVVVGNCGIGLAPLWHFARPRALTLLVGADEYVYPTMRTYVEAVDATRPGSIFRRGEHSSQPIAHSERAS